MRAAAEAVVELLVGAHPERRRLLVVERAAGFALAAGLLELHAAADQLHDVGACDQLVDEGLRDAAGHGTKIPQAGNGWPAVQAWRRRRSIRIRAAVRPAGVCTASIRTSPGARPGERHGARRRLRLRLSTIAASATPASPKRAAQDGRDLARVAAPQVARHFLEHDEVRPRGGGDRRKTLEIGILAIAGLAEQERQPSARFEGAVRNRRGPQAQPGCGRSPRSG